jgi:hypothetical protein
MRSSIFKFTVVFTLCLPNFACQNNAVGTTVNSSNAVINSNETATKPQSDFEKTLSDMRTGDFDYVFAFKRKDGGKFDRDDKDFLKNNTPQQTNRWLLTKDETVVFAGSNFIFSPDILKKLGARFAVEDYSPKKEVK